MGNKVSKLRLFLLVLGVTFFYLVLVGNFFRWQVMYHDLFVQAANNQYQINIIKHAQRGKIFDRSGNRLATNTIHYDLAVDPTRVDNKQELAEKIAPLRAAFPAAP